jgi:hypothetical protein
MMRTESAEFEIVAADAYPPLLSAARRQQALKLLRSHATLAKANRVLAMKSAELRGAVMGLVDRLDRAAQAADWRAVYETTHEIRGFAATAGLASTGRIANTLCHYLDTVEGLGLTPDGEIAQLHLDAILRSVRTEDDAARHGEAVAAELAALVARRLSDVKEAVTN